VDESKQRIRKPEPKYDCHGKIRLTFCTSSQEAKVNLNGETVVLQPNGVIVQFNHSEAHPPKERSFIPRLLRDYIRTHYKTNFHLMFEDIIQAAARSELEIDLNQITDSNLRYAWSTVRAERIETSKDPWQSAVNFLCTQKDVCKSSLCFNG
jgi:hypothetical protein